MLRTHTCGALRKEHSWQQVTLAGRVDSLRDMWGLIFIALRDRYGVTQLSYNPSDDAGILSDLLSWLKNEYCIQVTGVVASRPDGQANDSMDTGEIEIQISSLEVLNTCKELPYAIVDEPATSESTRMKYRYLDLRRKPVLDNIKFKAKMMHFTRNWFADEGFLDVQTPIFTVSSPEWSRDYLIPSRVNPGKFYALPQSPQQYKQLLMIGGVDKYFQIAPCFRDEDPRADRAMCEFYQVDIEMSFVEQEDVLDLLKAYSLDVAKHMTPHKTLKFGDEFPRISYHDAMNQYGIDRPDLRFGMKIVDVSELVKDSEFGVFSWTIKDWGVVRAIKLEWQTMTRKEIDAVTKIAKQAGAWGLAYMIFEDGWVRSPIAKFFSASELTALQDALDAQEGDMIFFGAWTIALVCKVLHKVRMHCRDTYDLVDDNELAFCFVVDFPFFEYDESNDSRDFGHNPFSHVVWWQDALENQPIGEIMTNQYDVILNGFEIGGWSIRNRDPEVLVKAFEKVGYDESEVKVRFGTMYEAMQYGCPPHGGCAFGFDRLMMILADEHNIREVYAFPKSGKAEDVMMWAPSFVPQELLEEANIVVAEQVENN